MNKPTHPQTTDDEDDPFAISMWAIAGWLLILTNVACAVWRIIHHG